MKYLILILLFTGCNQEDKLGDCFINVNQKVFGPYLTNLDGCKDLKKYFDSEIANYPSCQNLTTKVDYNLTDDVKKNFLNQKGWKINEVLKVAKRKIKKQLSPFLKINCQKH